MPTDIPATLSDLLQAGRSGPDRFLYGDAATVPLANLVGNSNLGGRTGEFRGRTVLVAPEDQLAAALTMIELDGVARRLVLCPAGLPTEHLRFVASLTGAEAIVSDVPTASEGTLGIPCIVPRCSEFAPSAFDRSSPLETEWILLTSGTTGLPKLVVHSLLSLTGAMKGSRPASTPPVWSTFYDIRRYGGLQIFLRALSSGGSMVLSSAAESTAAFLDRAGAHGVTHISGTPSHWRRALMSPMAARIQPEYIRLSGEIADQAILDHLRSFYPQARIAHAFASTEAGVAFDVNDGLAGFPASLIEDRQGDVELKVVDGSLRIRSSRTASGYFGPAAGPIRGEHDFVDTGDMLELRAGRYFFAGRRDGVVNVGGSKVHPEEVEAVINRHPDVHMSLVKTRKSPIMGALVVADVVLKSNPGSTPERIPELQREILQFCRQALPSHKVPASITVVPTLAVTATGKLMRTYA